MRACACLPTAWEGCLRKVHPILLLQEKSPYYCKIIATSLKIGYLEHCNARDQNSEGGFEEDGSCVR